MSELQVIEGALERAARRRRWDRALRGLWIGLLVGAAVYLIALAVFKLAPVPFEVLFWSGVVAAVCAVAGFIAGGWRKLTLAETARWVDVKQNLKERLSTALEVGAAHDGSRWEQLVLTDAASHVEEVDPRKLVRFSLPKVTRWALLVLALAAGLGFVPEYRTKAFQQKKADEKIIKDTGRQLANLTRREIQQRKPTIESTEKTMQSVAELGDQLAKANLTRSEALKDLANATEKLKDQLKEIAKDPAIQKLEQAARNPGNRDAQTAAGLQKQMESLQKQLGDKHASPEAMDKLQKDLEKLQEAAKAMSTPNSGATDADKQKLSASLSSLSQQAQQMGMNLPQLDEAIAALAANQTDRALKDLNEALNDLEKTRDMAKQLQQMQSQAEKLGKDLAEQLKYGQADAASETLKKLAQQLKSGQLSQDQMKKILDEVSQAIPQAKDFGKVQDLLKQGTKQMQQNDKPGASQSLADAAKELENLMQQMNDAEALAAAMENLKTASMCIGSCQNWGMCNRPGMGTKPGGKPGSGVGTWADDSQWYDGQWSDRWDNTGVQRPDQDPRGITERDQALSDQLKPDKVKGQFSPGGQMPSITLKGVSIKGTSTVQYEEAATAAQTDAQSALSQEKVPRAYQGAVKDYFDDLKK